MIKNKVINIFLIKDNGIICYKKVKYNALLSQIDKNFNQSLSNQEKADLLNITKLLQDRLNYHHNQFTIQQFDLMDKMLSTWSNINGPLNLIRLCIMHPHFATYHISKINTTNQQIPLINLIISKLADHLQAVEAKNETNEQQQASEQPKQQPSSSTVLLALYCLVNIFNRRLISVYMLYHIEDVLETVFNAYNVYHDHIKIKLAIIDLLLNYSQLITCMKLNEANKELIHESIIQLLSCSIDRLENELNEEKILSELKHQSKIEKIVYRLLVVIGTLLAYQKDNISLAKDLDFNAILLKLNDQHLSTRLLAK